MIEIVGELEATGRSLQHFCRELARYWRNLLVAKIAGKPTRLIAASEQEQAGLLETAAAFSEEDLTRYLNLTLDLYKTLQTSLQPRLHLELGLVKLVHAGRIRSIEQAIADLGPNTTTSPAPVGTPPLTAKSTLGTPARSTFLAPPPVKTVAATPAPSAEPPPLPAPAVRTGDLKQDLHNGLRAAGFAFSADAIQSAEVQLQGSELIIRAPKLMLMALKDASVQKVAAEVIGKPVRVRAEAGENIVAAAPKAPPANAVEPNDEVRERALADPAVKRFQELFPNAQIRSVRNLNE
jgi:DNA polymerase-3 subunit gamma/tau